MIRSSIFVVLLVFALPGLAKAQQAQLQPLFDALNMRGLINVMRDEGLEYAVGLEDEMFPGRGRERWASAVEKIYRIERMEQMISEGMGGALEPAEIEALMEFFGSERGMRIVGLEISARRALLDDAVEQATRDRWMEMEEAGGPRVDDLRRFVAANRLVDSNVEGAMNSNYAFMTGLVSAGAFPDQLSEDDILRDIWEQEPDIRLETESWVFSYLALAYKPLSDGDLAAYIELSESEAGQALNAALFSAFDALFITLSRDLGLAAGQFIGGQDI